MKILYSFLVILFSFFAFKANAQLTKLAYRYTTTNSDLPSNIVYNIITADDGNVWMGTEKGLVKFNGTSFKTFNLLNKMAGDDVVNLFHQPENHTLWALTFNSKLIQVNTKTNTITNLQPKGKIVETFMYGYIQADTLKFLTANQIFTYLNGEFKISLLKNIDLKTQLFYNQKEDFVFNKNLFQEVDWQLIENKYFSKEKRWIKNNTRISKYGMRLFENEIFYQSKNKIYSILDINTFIKGTNQFIVDVEVVGTDLYLAIYGSEGGIYLAKDLFKNPKKAKLTLISEKGLGLSVAKDKIGNIWYSLRGKGLNVISINNLNSQYIALPSTKNENYSQIIGLNDSTFAINDLASKNYQVISTAKKTITSFSKANVLSSTSLNAKLSTFLSPYGAITKDVSKDGKMFFANRIITYDNNFKIKRQYLIFKENGYLRSGIRQGDYYKDNIIFNTSDDSIYVFNTHKKQIVKKLTLPNAKAIKDIYYLNNNYILFCTASGIFTTDFSFKKITQLSKKEYSKAIVDSNAVYLINESNLAVFKLNNPSKITNLFSTKSYISKFNIIDFNVTANKIHLLTDLGYIGINKSIINQQKNNITFNLSSLELKDSVIYDIKNTISLKDIPTKQIKFNIDFFNPENNNYQKHYAFTKYGEVDEWVTFNGNTFSQNNLSPDNYTLKIKIGLADTGIEKTITYQLKIKPTFWQTKWFLACCILLAIVLVSFIIYFIINKREKKKIVELAFQKKISDIENKAFLNQLNPHFLYNALNTLQDYIIKKDTHNGITYLQRVTSLHRNILEFNQKTYITVSEEKKILEKYLFVQQKRYSDKFDYQIDIDKDAENLKLPPMLLQPIIENAIEYGFANLHQKGFLKVSFLKENNHLTITITDNGNGNVDKILPLKEGHALHIIKERLAFVNIKNKTKLNNISFIANQPNGIIVKLTITLNDR